jgi:hypothetical protein
MAISAKALEQKIKDALAEYNSSEYKNNPENPQHLKVLGDTLKEYFEENTDITYAWAATLPPPASTPDPVVSFKSEVSFPSFDLTTAKGLEMLALLIQAAFVSATIKHASGFTVTPGTFLVKAPPVLKKISTSEEAEIAIYSCITVPVCAWVLTLVNPTPLSGTHAAYSGATKGMVIA